MLAKKIALGFGIAVILPLLVHYGVSTFTPQPKWQEYYQYRNYTAEQGASVQERAKLEAERVEKERAYHKAEKVFQERLFIVAVPIGLGAIVFGSLGAVQAIGTGLMFGGIFTLTEGYCLYWSELQDGMRFLSLLVAFAVLVYVGYHKLEK